MAFPEVSVSDRKLIGFAGTLHSQRFVVAACNRNLRKNQLSRLSFREFNSMTTEGGAQWSLPRTLRRQKLRCKSVTK